MNDLEDELEAINAIYPESMLLVDELQFKLILPHCPECNILINFNEQYPNEIPEIKDVLNSNQAIYVDSNYLIEQANKILNKIFIEGEVCCYELITELDEYFTEYLKEREKSKLEQAQESDNKKNHDDNDQDARTGTKYVEGNFNKNNSNGVEDFSDWVLSEPVVDRGSTFIAFAKSVHSVEEAQEALDAIISSRRVSKANHNMSCWRIQKENGVRYQDCDDDGEAAAGSKILHLMTLMDVWNVVIVVSRWFGGIHIGPDRFKHIKTASRDAIIKGGFSPKETSSHKKPSSEGKKKK